MILGLVVVIVLINAAVSIAVARSNLYDKSQKRFQFGLIWLIPVAGAVVAWSVLKANTTKPVLRIDQTTGNSYVDYSGADPSLQPEASGSHHDGGGMGGHH